MKVVVTEYAGLARDADQRFQPLAGARITSQKRTSAGTFTALASATRIVRVATDTAIHFKPTGAGAADTDEMMLANSAEFFAVAGGATPSIITA